MTNFYMNTTHNWIYVHCIVLPRIDDTLAKEQAFEILGREPEQDRCNDESYTYCVTVTVVHVGLNWKHPVFVCVPGQGDQ